MSIKAQELRIGNFVKGIYIGEDSIDEIEILCKVDGVCDNGMFDWPIVLQPLLNAYYDITEYERVEGIPITEEWLLRFGWGRSDEHELCDNSNYIIFIWDHHFKKMYIDTDSDLTYLPHIKYIHQLQNLIHALTGKELELKDK